MKYFITLAFSFLMFTLYAQDLDLENLEETFLNIETDNYRPFLEENKFQLVESSREGKNGVYENWMNKENNLYLKIQRNDIFRFTKMILSSRAGTNKDFLQSLIDQINKNYGTIFKEGASYFVKEENPDTTVYIIFTANEEASVDGIMFFHKF